MSRPTSQPPVDQRAYRRAMGAFATGVTVIGTEVEGQFHGMTANAITSVSLDPLLLLVCVGKDTHCANQIQQSGGFSVNILSQDQADLSSYFANMWASDAPPPTFTFESWPGGPRLADCAAALGCALHATYDGGDHWIIVGRVVALYQNESPTEPLLYYRGHYFELTPLTDA